MRTLKNILTLMLKEFRSVLTDPVLMVLIAYIFTATIYQMAQVGADLKNATVGIIDQDRSVLSMRIRDAVQHPFFKPVEDVRRENSDELMDKGEFTFILEVPPNFQRDMAAGRNPDLQLLVDATSMTQAGVGASYLSQIINREIYEFTGVTRPELISPVINTYYNPNGESAWFMPTSQIGSMSCMLLILLTGAAVIRERERGTIEHLLVMPVNAFELMMGKVLANAAVIWVAALSSLWFIVHLSIGVPLIGSVPLYAVGLALFLFSVASLGIMIATFASTMGQFGMLMLPVYIVMNLFAGGASPRSNMPHAAQLISEYWPLTQFVKFSQDILFRGAGIEIVWGHMLIMGCIGVGFLWLALLRFQGMLERQG